jgi:arginine-tRNA-protein transferase
MNNISYKLGVTEEFECNYLPDKKERLLIAVDERLQNNESYSWLMSQGFRRSGEQSYRPHCTQCNACQSLRVIVDNFVPTKSQKRTVKRNSALIIKESSELKDSYYPLYEQYINTCHQDGTMYPANIDQFRSFLSCKLTQQLFIETWLITDDVEQLLCVAVTDVLSNALSAVYTFYHPEFKDKSLGINSILTQLNICQQRQLPYLYLGYQIDDCQKMNYKNRYYPHERYIDGQWLYKENLKLNNKENDK